MYTIVNEQKKKHHTPTRVVTSIFVKCSNCGAEQFVVDQNVRRANREGRKKCQVCWGEDHHNMTDTRIWGIWRHMVSRATNKKDPDFIRYGANGRGVTQHWLDFKNFYQDMADGYADNLTLDRIDNSQGYSKANCRWATNMQQQANKTTNRLVSYLGQETHLAEFCRKAGVSRGAISPRLALGMTGDEALTDYKKSKYPKGRKSRKSMT